MRPTQEPLFERPVTFFSNLADKKNDTNIFYLRRPSTASIIIGVPCWYVRTPAIASSRFRTSPLCLVSTSHGSSTYAIYFKHWRSSTSVSNPSKLSGSVTQDKGLFPGYLYEGSMTSASQCYISKKMPIHVSCRHSRTVQDFERAKPLQPL